MVAQALLIAAFKKAKEKEPRGGRRPPLSICTPTPELLGLDDLGVPFLQAPRSSLLCGNLFLVLYLDSSPAHIRQT